MNSTQQYLDQLIEDKQTIVDNINSSFFGKMMYNNNVVVKYIYNGTKLEDSSEDKTNEK